MSAPAAAGTLALIQQYFIESNHITPTPALLKALLINGARSLNHIYDFNTRPSSANIQGWGLINLPNSLPQGSNGVSNMAYFDQSQSPPLRTGESNSYTINLPDSSSVNFPLRVTLVWTDPPGNPAAGLALVNDLDLVVTDSKGAVYVGNDFESGDIYTRSNSVGNAPTADFVNNVENVYIGVGNGPLAPPYTVTVRGHRVNVNAVTTQTNNIEQDYALVISSDNTNSKASMSVSVPSSLAAVQPFVTIASNGVALLNQRVGANSPYDYQFAFGATNGTPSQWHFFIFTNDTIRTYVTNTATNVAFVTFLPPNLSVPRVTQEADIDLYVSTNFNLTNLNSATIAKAVSDGTVSRNRGGTEAVVFSNSLPNSVYYIGVKSEDQQAATFGFLGVASLTPFSDQMPDGDVVAHGIPLPLAVPDGSFDHPGMTNVLAVVEGGDPIHIRHVIVTNGIAHRHPTDLVGTLSFSGKAVTLNNQTGDSTNYVVAYDDEPEGPSQDPNISTVFTDGPGSLKDYIGLPVGNAAVWRLDETDNALGQVGSITRLDILMEHQPPNTGTFAINLQGFGSYYGYVIVPTDATNLGIAVTYQNSGNAGPVSIYATNDPDVNTGDTLATMDITPPGGALNINSASNPPISGGVWYYLIQNNGAADVSLNVTISIQRRLTPNFIQTFTNKVATALTTDAHTKSQICIDAASLAQAVVSVNVGVRLNDPDLDNLALHLTSPVGTSVLLFENRGGPSATNLGLNSSNPNEPIYTIFTEDTNLTSSLIKFTPVFAQSNYVAPASIVSSFEAPTVEGTYETGSSVDKWTVLTNQIGVVADPNVARDGDNFLALTTARISRSFDTTVGTTYHFVYYARGPGIIDWWPANGNANDIIGGNDGVATNIIYDDGVFGKGFYFNGSNSLITFGTQAGNFRTNDFTIDYWVNRPPANITSEGFLEKRLSCDASSSFISLRWGGTGFVYGQHGLEVLGESYLNDFDFMPSIDDHTWHHIVWTRRGSLFTGYLDGISPLSREVSPIADINNNARLQMGPSVCLAGDKTVPYNGAADELDFWSRALCPAEALAIFRAGSAGKYSTNSILPNMFVSVDDHTTNLVINNSTNWVAYTNTFVASSSKTTIEFAGNSALSMLLDDITLTALPSTNFNNYFKPEESLSAFVGENPVGCWTLDVWDTRTDNVLPTHGTLQSWTLDLTFSSTNVDLIVLTNHVPYSNSITAQSTVYLAFDAPGDAHYATNTITNSATPGTLNLVFNQQALPTGTSAGDAFFALNLPSGASSATVLNDTSSQPPLEPGNRYFLAVQNPNAAAKQYTVQVDTDIPPTNQLTALGNGVLVRTNIIGNGGPQYFSFDVPENAVLASFQVLNAINGEVDLYARYGLPLPGPLNFDYESVAFDSSNQPIVVTTNSSFTTNSAPQPLQPGTWYLATYGRPPIGALSYQIIASYLTDDRVVTIIPLTNGVAFTNIAAPGYPTNLFYSFTNHVKAAGVRFVLTNLTAAGNVDLVVGWGSLPTPAQSYSGSFNLGAIPERVDVATNDLLPALTKTWYLAVPNDWTNKVRYAVEALSVDVPPITNFPSIAQQSIGRDFGFTLTWASAPGATYQVDYSTDLIDWIPAARLTATNNVSSYTDATPVTNESARYYRLRQEPSE
jgi:subtilisin-like proprotein convertase family protein